ncbi:serine hydrolase FSH [Peziza echinospora]|nr:serine hydrolase FSH [Peziza echinospora]
MSTMTPPPLPRPLKILMLHGYTQTPQTFYQKTRSLDSHLQKTLPQLIPKNLLAALPPPPPSQTPTPTPTPPPSSSSTSPPPPLTTPATKPVILTYPAGPLKLLHSDLPGYDPTTTTTTTPADTDTETESEALAWWIRSDPSGTLKRRTLPYLLSILHTAATLENAPYDGVIGFSQGGALAVLLAGLLEPQPQTHSTLPEDIAIPPGIPPLAFAVSYSGFRVMGDTDGEWDFLYDRPGGITTPTLHFIGSLDTVVEEARTLAVARVCERGNVGRKDGEGSLTVYHPGGHYLPGGKQFLGVLAGWVAGRVREARERELGIISDGASGGGGEKKEEEVEEKVEDMDVPF